MDHLSQWRLDVEDLQRPSALGAQDLATSTREIAGYAPYGGLWHGDRQRHPGFSLLDPSHLERSGRGCMPGIPEQAWVDSPPLR